MRPRLIAWGFLLLVASACAPASDPTTTTLENPQPTATPTTQSSTTTLGPAVPIALNPSPGVVRAQPPLDAPTAQLVEGLNQAGFELWRTQSAESNLVFSPSSIGHALLMARAAADGPTGAAIDEAFGLPDGIAAHEAWNAIYHSIIDSAERAEPVDSDEEEGAPDEDVVVVMADRIWPDVSATPSQEWIDLLVAQHGAGVEVLELFRNPEGSADAINAWIEEQTRGLIRDMASPADVAGNILILTDTVYFKASWLFGFAKIFTESDTFTRLDGTTVEVPFMAHEEWGPRAARGDGWTAAEIPYIGEEFSMLLIVPDEGRFEELRDALDGALAAEIDESLYSANHQLFMPKWDNGASIDLMPWLESVGAAPGSYPGIDPAAFLGGAKHAAKIIVDELGTEAAAATMLVHPVSVGPPIDIVVRADRPFLYLIRHKPTGLILFAGQVTDPSQTSG